MKVRKLAVALALAGGLGSGMANALGLGEIELQSWLNEPLDAEISLRQSQGMNPADVFVNVAPEAAYQRVGLERDQFLSKLRFEVVTGADGGLAINVSSREPLREPYLNFLLELTWPSGRLMREYSVLVDPPVYAEESGVDESVAAPSTARTETRPERSAESRRRQARAERSLSRDSGSSRTYGPTGASDTLWSIAQRMRPDTSVSMNQVMLAIQEENPNAFMGGNINRLKRGEVLRVPSAEQMRSRSRAEASRLVARQNQEFQSPELVDATRTSQTEAAQQAEGVEGANGDSELKLLVADEEITSARDAEEGGSAGGDGDLPGGQDAGSAVANEELDSLRRENEELDSRLNDLQDQVETLRRLLELKDNQLSDLQGMAGDTAEEQGTGGAAQENVAAGDTPATTTEDSGNAPQESGPAQPAATVADSSEAPAADQEPEESAPAQKPFPGNIINVLMSNPVYQIALGGGLIILLLLLVLMTYRRAKKEKAFFDQFASEEAEEKGEDSFDLDLDDESEGTPGSGVNNPLAEADNYLAYGQHEQAAQVLETAISREPSRTDLRVKLLGVYADSQDRHSFEKQYGELAALEDETATAQAEGLRARLDEAETAPSIDDLESQLRSDGTADVAEEVDASDDQVEFDLSLADLDEAEEPESPPRDSGLEAESETSAETDISDQADEDITEGLSLEEEPDLTEDLSSLELDESPELEDMSSEFEETMSEKPEQSEAEPSEDDLSLASEELDDSFLDELDAELDKVSEGEKPVSEPEPEPEPEAEAGETGLNDLDMELSEEDLAIMDELSDSEDIPSLDEEVTEADEPGPSASPEQGKPSALDLDESDLGDDDDFDFLAGTDEAATKLDLARAYVEMGDSDGARDILEEVALEGNDEQKVEAQELLKNLS